MKNEGAVQNIDIVWDIKVIRGKYMYSVLTIRSESFPGHDKSQLLSQLVVQRQRFKYLVLLGRIGGKMKFQQNKEIWFGVKWKIWWIWRVSKYLEYLKPICHVRKIICISPIIRDTQTKVTGSPSRSNSSAVRRCTDEQILPNLLSPYFAVDKNCEWLYISASHPVNEKRQKNRIPKHKLIEPNIIKLLSNHGLWQNPAIVLQHIHMYSLLML